jgi:hypothetical protein
MANRQLIPTLRKSNAELLLPAFERVEDVGQRRAERGCCRCSGGEDTVPASQQWSQNGAGMCVRVLVQHYPPRLGNVERCDCLSRVAKVMRCWTV